MISAGGESALSWLFKPLRYQPYTIYDKQQMNFLFLHVVPALLIAYGNRIESLGSTVMHASRLRHEIEH